METHKRDTCPVCCPDDRCAIWIASHGYLNEDIAEYVPVWMYNNCGTKKARRVVRNVTRDEGGMTRAQRVEIERLRGAVLLCDHDEVRGLKTEVTTYGAVWVTIDVAPHGLHHPLLETHWFILVGPRGRSVAHSGPEWFMKGRRSRWNGIHRYAPRPRHITESSSVLLQALF